MWTEVFVNEFTNSFYVKNIAIIFILEGHVNRPLKQSDRTNVPFLFLDKFNGILTPNVCINIQILRSEENSD